MPSSSHSSDASIKVTGSGDRTPRPTPASSPFSELCEIIELTDLPANAGQAARLANLTHSNLNATTNRSAQNAVANQQAHAMLTTSVVGKAANKVQNLGPLEGRSSVDILTSNEIANTLMSLKGAMQAFSGGGGGRPGPRPSGPVSWVALRATLQRALEQIRHVNTVNGQLTGDGSLANPFVTEQKLYTQSGTSFGFPGYTPAQINIEMLRRLLTGR